MKILFIENKNKTMFYRKLAKELEQYNYTSSFLIQNKIFAASKNDYFISSTLKKSIETKELNQLFLECLDKVSQSDRNLNYFDGNKTHYKAYFYNIYQALNNIKPNVVFGESTLFHELMTIFICKYKNIPYFHPSSCRIPSQRFSFYQKDSLIPFSGSKEIATDTFCLEIIENFGYRKKQLDYMVTPNRKEVLLKKGRLAKNALTGIYSRLVGEKFNTPSLQKKLSLQSELKKNIKAWEKLARNNLSGHKKKILYPLHMQPECNIDVWSRKYRDQVKTIYNISKQLPPNWELFVKPNPKSKYEMNSNLINMLSPQENITLLSHTVNMKDISNDIDLFITASGTIAYECFLTEKPCLSLSLPFFESQCKERHLTNIDWDEIHDKYTEQIKNSKASPSQLINYLLQSSYDGIISDPISTPYCISKNNIQIVGKAFKDVLNKIKENSEYSC